MIWNGLAFCHITLAIKLIYGDTLQNFFLLSSVLSVTANLAKDYSAISSSVELSSIHLAKIKKPFLDFISFFVLHSCYWTVNKRFSFVTFAHNFIEDFQINPTFFAQVRFVQPKQNRDQNLTNFPCSFNYKFSCILGWLFNDYNWVEFNELFYQSFISLHFDRKWFEVKSSYFY